MGSPRTKAPKIAAVIGFTVTVKATIVGETAQSAKLHRSHHPSNFLVRWPCRGIEGRGVNWERLEGGDGRDQDDGGRDWGRLGRALTAAEQEAARRFGSPCGDRLGRA